ncbi:MAG: LysM peptidoglycan-binding domain-containing protein [Bacteroidota bacterium]
MALIGLWFLFGLLTTNPAHAQQTSPKVHVVQKGETLFSIARAYDITVQDIKVWNNLQTSSLNVGQELIVAHPDDEEKTIRHTVQKGETLYGISKEYGVSISSIRNWNSLNNDALTVGQVLTIYPPEQLSLTESQEKQIKQDSDTTNSLITQESSNIPTTYYTVKSGDNLYNIARDYNMSVDQLKQLNDLKGNTIRVGQQLTVRKTREDLNVIESEESIAAVQGNFKIITLSAAARPKEIYPKYEMDSTEFAMLNPDISWESTLIEGDKVTVLLPAKKTTTNPYRTNSRLNTLGNTSISTYTDTDIGTPTTSGELYNPEALTAAHASIALGSVIYVQNPVTKRGLIVLINDRGSNKGLKLSHLAYKMLGFNKSNDSNKQLVNIYKELN